MYLIAEEKVVPVLRMVEAKVAAPEVVITAEVVDVAKVAVQVDSETLQLMVGFDLR